MDGFWSIVQEDPGLGVGGGRGSGYGLRLSRMLETTLLTGVHLEDKRHDVCIWLVFVLFWVWGTGRWVVSEAILL